MPEVSVPVTPGDLYQISDVEEDLCVTCRFRKNPDEDGQHAQEYPMCYEIEAKFMGDDPVEELHYNRVTRHYTCSKYMKGDPWETFGDEPGQEKMF